MSYSNGEMISGISNLSLFGFMKVAFLRKAQYYPVSIREGVKGKS
jgi:hypothetical protein